MHSEIVVKNNNYFGNEISDRTMPAARMTESIKEENSMMIQFKKGVLELCVLSMLKQDDQYGYDVASKLSQSIDVADGSIYLVLRRLKQDEYVSSYLEESSGGPPRKYYVITRKGEEFLDQLIAEWNQLVGSVNGIIGNSGAACQEFNAALQAVESVSVLNGGNNCEQE